MSYPQARYPLVSNALKFCSRRVGENKREGIGEELWKILCPLASSQFTIITPSQDNLWIFTSATLLNAALNTSPSTSQCIREASNHSGGQFVCGRAIRTYAGLLRSEPRFLVVNDRSSVRVAHIHGKRGLLTTEGTRQEKHSSQILAAGAEHWFSNLMVSLTGWFACSRVRRGPMLPSFERSTEQLRVARAWLPASARRGPRGRVVAASGRDNCRKFGYARDGRVACEPLGQESIVNMLSRERDNEIASHTTPFQRENGVSRPWTKFTICFRPGRKRVAVLGFTHWRQLRVELLIVAHHVSRLLLSRLFSDQPQTRRAATHTEPLSASCILLLFSADTHSCSDRWPRTTSPLDSVWELLSSDSRRGSNTMRWTESSLVPIFFCAT